MAQLSDIEPFLGTDQLFFVKLHTHLRQPLFRQQPPLPDRLTDLGQIVVDEWQHSGDRQAEIRLDCWRLTADALQGIVAISKTTGQADLGRKPWLLSSFVASFKASAAKRINLTRNTPGRTVWQPNYQDRRLDDSTALNRARQLLDRFPSP